MNQSIQTSLKLVPQHAPRVPIVERFLGISQLIADSARISQHTSTESEKEEAARANIPFLTLLVPSLVQSLYRKSVAAPHD